MPVSTALVIAAAIVVLAVVAGIVIRLRDGRRRAARGIRVDSADVPGGLLADAATLVQFSTEFCARCPQVRRMLGAEAARHDGVAHVEIDLTHRADLSAKYRVLQTPTTFLVDADGTVLTRWAGAPRPADVAAAVVSALPSASTTLQETA